MLLQKWFVALVLIFFTNKVFAQQMVLGKNPYAMNKSAVLELNADNQGLLLPRITDTTSINSLNPPDGMVIYFVPTRRLLVRTSGYWSTLAPASSSISMTTGTTGTDVNISGSPVALGGTVTLNLPSASASARGLLTPGDWTTFNSKVGTARTLSTTAPLTGGGDLSADRTLSMTQAGASTNGWLSSTDWNTFNNKGPGSVTSVGLSLPSIFSVSNSPVTTAGTLTAALSSQSGNTVFAAPNGAAGTPSFRLLQKGDLPSSVVYADQANTYAPGMKQTFRGSTTSAGASFGGALTADPLTLTTGDIWFRSDAGKLRYFDGTTAKYIATEGSFLSFISGSGTLNYVPKFTPDGNTIGNSNIVDNGTNIGINTASPNATLDINGDLALRLGSYTAVNGPNHNINLPKRSVIRITGITTNSSITSIAGGFDGRKITLFNTTGSDITVVHESIDGSVVVSNRIWSPGGGSAVIPRFGSVTLIYSSTDSRWLIIGITK